MNELQEYIPQYGWISVKEMLPDENKRVLVYASEETNRKDYFVTMGSLLQVDDDENEFWLIIAPKGSTVWMIKGLVSHWMEMPEHP